MNYLLTPLAAAAGIRADHFLMAQAWFFLPLVILYALATRTLALDPAALWGSLGFHLHRFLLFHPQPRRRLDQHQRVDLPAEFYRHGLARDRLARRTVDAAGLAFALLATWQLVGASAATDGAPKDTRRRSLVQVAVATLAFGTSTFFHTVGLRHGALPETLAVAQAALFMPLATAVVYFADRKLRPPPMTFRYGAAAAIALFGATIFLLRAVAAGQASVLVPIAQMGFIVAALLGIFILRERVTARKAIGLVSALAALAVLAGS